MSTMSDETLIAFVDGELPEAERAEIERALVTDQALRDRVDAHRKLRARLSAAFDGALHEPPPLAILSLLETTPAAQGNVVELADRRSTRRWSAREFAAMAASLAAGLLIGLGVVNGQAPMIATTAHGLVARGQLARALETQLASATPGPVRIGLTFRARDGGYCRAFDLTRAASSGVACRDEEGWSVVMTAASGPQGEVRTASAPPAIMNAIDNMIDGAPLDAAAEARVRDSGWRE